MTLQELLRQATMRADQYVKVVFNETPSSASIEEAPAPSRCKILEGPAHWSQARGEAPDATATVYSGDFIVLTSKDIPGATLKRRIARFLEEDDYWTTKGPHGRIEYHIQAEMLGWINRRNY